MANRQGRKRLYSPSAIGKILKIARERACQEEHRTKRYMAEALGITVERLTRMENGTSHIPFEIAVEWCKIVEDDTALAKIKHIYLNELPPTDPRLLQSVADQLVNFIRQAEEAIKAAQELLNISTSQRPGKKMDDSTIKDVYTNAEEILDTYQASQCVLKAMNEQWGMDVDKVKQSWIMEAIAEGVVIPSVTEYENMKKDEFFRRRMWEMQSKSY